MATAERRLSEIKYVDDAHFRTPQITEFMILFVCMDTPRDALPEDITALKAALASERAKALDIAAELAVALAKASEDSALIAQQKLRIAKLRAPDLRAKIGTLVSADRPAGAYVRRAGSQRHRRRACGRKSRRQDDDCCADLRARAPNAIPSPTIFPASAW